LKLKIHWVATKPGVQLFTAGNESLQIYLFINLDFYRSRLKVGCCTVHVDFKRYKMPRHFADCLYK
jgi:hypothetical protein